MIEIITQLAHRFRRAMDETDFSDTQWLKHFPRETCDITCKLLGVNLYQHGIVDLAILCGNRPDAQEGKHQWLRSDNIVIDITADQFEGEEQPPVIVTRFSHWHGALAGQLIKVFDDAYFDLLMNDPFAEFMREMYARVCANIDSDQHLIAN